MVEYFVDTCVIIGYATYIKIIANVEKYGLHCEKFFNDNHERICSRSVERELNRVKNKRLRLYKEVCKYLERGLDVDQIRMEIDDDKLRDHLIQILNSLKAIPIMTQHDKNRLISNFRYISRIFNLRIKNALKKIKEIIDVDEIHPYRHERISWGQLLGEIIDNTDDGQILVDCMIISHYRGNLIFITLDEKDIINNKDKIFKFAEEHCSTSINPNFDIKHLAELYPDLH